MKVLSRGLLLLAILLAGCAPVPPVFVPPTPAALQPSSTSTLASSATLTPAAPTPNPTPTLQPSPTPIVTSAAPSDLAAAAQIDAYLASLTTQGLFNGSVLVARAGRVLLVQGYGQADRAQGISNTPGTQFRLASITKQFTAASILMLQARARLNVQDPICHYIAPCPAAWQAITIHQVLSHTSGLPDYMAQTDYPRLEATPAAPGQIMARLSDLPLDFTPGRAWNYSNTGYIVLGEIIEKVSGQSYADFLEQNIFRPLEMSASGYDSGDNRTGVSALALGYRNQFASSFVPAPAGLFADGGLYSTVEDLYRWDQALYTHKLLPQDLLDAMFTPYAAVPVTGGPSTSSYGYGWFIGKNNGRRAVWHPGAIDGVATIILRYPDDHAVVILLSNQENTRVVQIASEAAAILFGGN